MIIFSTELAQTWGRNSAFAKPHHLQCVPQSTAPPQRHLLSQRNLPGEDPAGDRAVATGGVKLPRRDHLNIIQTEICWRKPDNVIQWQVYSQWPCTSHGKASLHFLKRKIYHFCSNLLTLALAGENFSHEKTSTPGWQIILHPVTIYFLKIQAGS